MSEPRLIVRFHQALMAKDETAFIYALTDILVRYKLFRYLKGPKGDPGGDGDNAFNGIRTISGAVTASITDIGKLLILDASLQSTTYTIDPLSFNNKRFYFYCIDNAHGAVIHQSSGNIFLRNLESKSSIGMDLRESMEMVCDGTKLIQTL